MIACFYSYLFITALNENIRQKVPIYLLSSITYIILNIPFIILITYPSKDYNICKYPFNCEKGQNDTIATSNYYYAIPGNKDKLSINKRNDRFIFRNKRYRR